jgi:2-oxoglutarate dehydrogenase E1 component
MIQERAGREHNRAMRPPDHDAIGDAFRRWGYLRADLDPLGRLAPFTHREIERAETADPAAAARWNAIYCGPLAADFMHIPDPERCDWISRRMEAAAEPLAVAAQGEILRRLAQAELLERFLHKRYAGTKRYSLEGAASLIPLLDAALDAASAGGVELALVGMAHRGRLNVMVNVVGTPAEQLFAGFEDVDPRSVLGGGDVKYHLGATGEFRAAGGRTVRMHLVSNPSHLEAVDPVVMGRVRARQERLGADGRRRVLAVTLHGDAAFAGQGIAAETLNMADLPGFRVGGTLHVVVNNLIGFTTAPGSLHSCRFASDLAKRQAIPVFHVNGQDPEAVARAGRLAADYRAAFASDVVVDLICYRRYGHSEVDDPTITQPLLYERIAGLPMLWQDYAGRTGVPAERLAALEEEILDGLQRERDKGRTAEQRPVLRVLPPYWDRYRGGLRDEALEAAAPGTGVPGDRLVAIAQRITSAPEGFSIHPKVRKGLSQRLEMVRGERKVDWGMAEALAFGSLLWEGTPVRLSGEDSRRGTFNQRHAVLIDTKTGAEHVPLSSLREGQARFDVYDSPLSEAAAVGFEYGFSRDMPEALVCWEAQFGDFVNGAQVIIDQFLSSGEDKWGLLSGLVLLLPHGFEGQGAEHSSARLERFLALAAEDNMQVCQPSTAAQYFHLLRRQALRDWRKPLIVMTPKGLLRSEAAASPVEEFGEGAFRPLLADQPGAERLLLCTGKIAHELRAERAKQPGGGALTAIATFEELYPFPGRELADALEANPQLSEIVWIQEEPENMGALRYIRPLLQRAVDKAFGTGARHVRTIKRSASATPATGSTQAHALEQRALLALAFPPVEA